MLIAFVCLSILGQTALATNGYSLTLEPDYDINPVDTEHTVTATLENCICGGKPVEGAQINFEVISGPNAGLKGTGTTDSNGQATFSYTGEEVGIDEIKATYCACEAYSACATKVWVGVCCQETVNPHGKTVPPAGSTTMPGPKGGINDDGFYELSLVLPEIPPCSNIDLSSLKILVVDSETDTEFGPFDSGMNIKYTEANGAEPDMKKIGSDKGQAGAVAWHITGQGDMCLKLALVNDGGYKVLDGCACDCLVPPLPK